MMHADDVLVIIEDLAAVGVGVWLDGGWGVDALVGEQTREHDDLDMVIALDQAGAARAALAAAGFVLTQDESPRRFILCDAADRRIDFHPVTFDARGMVCRGCRTAPASGTHRRDSAVQVLCHLGYPPDANDRHDMRLLRDRCGANLPISFECD